eukprot:Pgem_evm1s8727
MKFTNSLSLMFTLASILSIDDDSMAGAAASSSSGCLNCFSRFLRPPRVEAQASQTFEEEENMQDTDWARYELLCRNKAWGNGLDELTVKLVNANQNAGYDQPEKYNELYHETQRSQMMLSKGTNPQQLFRGVSSGFYHKYVKNHGVSPKCPDCKHTVKYHVREGNVYLKENMFMDKHKAFCTSYKHGTSTQFVSWAFEAGPAVGYALTDYSTSPPSRAQTAFLLQPNTDSDDCKNEITKNMKYYSSRMEGLVNMYSKTAETTVEQQDDVYNSKSITSQWYVDAREVLMDVQGSKEKRLPFRCLTIWGIKVDNDRTKPNNVIGHSGMPPEINNDKVQPGFYSRYVKQLDSTIVYEVFEREDLLEEVCIDFPNAPRNPNTEFPYEGKYKDSHYQGSDIDDYQDYPVYKNMKGNGHTLKFDKDTNNWLITGTDGGNVNSNLTQLSDSSDTFKRKNNFRKVMYMTTHDTLDHH